MTDVHAIASTGCSCSLITGKYIFCCCQSHHFLPLIDCFCLLVLLKVSSCCGCYCLLCPADWPADWPADCWSPFVFLLLPLLLCHCCAHLPFSKCGCQWCSIEDGQCNVHQHHSHHQQLHWQHCHWHHQHQTFFSWHMQFMYCTLHIQSVAFNFLNPKFTMQDNDLSVNSP